MNELTPIEPETGPTSTDSGSDPGDGDPRVVRALCEYQAALDAGRRPDRHAFLARHSEIAGELAACLEGLEFVHAATHEARNLVAPLGPGLGDTQTDQNGPSTPVVLGDFQILREAGRGGMGVVYEAEQISLRRRVALKVLPFAATLDAKQLQRFKNEAQAAAQPQHPHIVSVLAVGCEAAPTTTRCSSSTATVWPMRSPVASRPWRYPPTAGQHPHNRPRFP